MVCAVLCVLVAPRFSSAEPLVVTSIVGGVGSFPIPAKFTDYTFDLNFKFSCEGIVTDCLVTDWHAEFQEDDPLSNDNLGKYGANFKTPFQVNAGDDGTTTASVTIPAALLSGSDDLFEGRNLEIIGTGFLTWDTVPPTEEIKSTTPRAITPVPEPATIGLVGAGLGWVIRRRRHRPTTGA